MKHYKDPITNALYAYEEDGSQDEIIPAHLVAVTNSEADAIRAAKAAENLPQMKSVSIETVKNLRRIVFSALAGLQSEALASGDAITAAAIVPVQQALRDLPSTDLSACQCQADIDASFLNAWGAIVAITPANVVSAFNGVL